MTATQVFDDYELDPARFELRRAGVPVPMEPQVFELLSYLVAHHDRIVLKDELIEHIWPERYISEAALNSRVMAARKAIGDNGKDQALIRTIRGRGFRFIGRVREAVEVPGTGAQAVAGQTQPAVVPEPGRGGIFGLDVAATSFIGRADELARLEEMMARPACRLVTIAGPGGVGKTRLAAELMQRLCAAGLEAVSVGLQSVHSVQDLHVAIADALGLRLAAPEPQAIARNLGERQAFVLLDNFEHLVSDGAYGLSLMLAQAPMLRLVVTSREVLGLREEWLFPVAGLSLDDEAGVASDAVELFLEREAQAGLADPGPRDDEAVQQICELVDGMPLGLELAASLRRYLTRREIATNIRRSVDVLRSDLRNLPQRHRSIPGLLDESVQRLTEEQAKVLFGLAVFEGSFSLEAAARVSNAALAVVQELVDRSLVQPRQGRFALHPLLRQYSREHMGFTAELLQRAHAEYFIQFLVERREALDGGDQVAASLEVEGELPNVLAAWRWACDNRRLDLLGKAAQPLCMYAHLRGRFVEVRDAFIKAVGVAELAAEDDWRALASLAMCKTWALIRTTRGPEVLATLGRAEELYRSHGEQPPPGFGTDPLAIRAMVHWAGGRYPAMVATAEEAAGEARARSDVGGEAFALWLQAVGLNRIPELYWDTAPGHSGQYGPASAESRETIERAARLLDHTESLLAAAGDAWFRSFILVERVLTAKALGDSDLAIDAARRAVAFRESFGDSRGVADALITLADCYIDRGDSQAVAECLARATPLVRRLGDLAIISEWDRAAALADWINGDYDSALRRFVAVAELSLQIGSVNNVLAAHRGIGDVLIEQGEYRTAAELLTFVSGHPATMPFSRARAETALSVVGSHLSNAAIDEIRQSMRSAHLPSLTASVVARLRERLAAEPGTASATVVADQFSPGG